MEVLWLGYETTFFDYFSLFMLGYGSTMISLCIVCNEYLLILDNLQQSNEET